MWTNICRRRNAQRRNVGRGSVTELGCSTTYYVVVPSGQAVKYVTSLGKAHHDTSPIENLHQNAPTRQKICTRGKNCTKENHQLHLYGLDTT